MRADEEWVAFCVTYAHRTAKKMHSKYVREGIPPTDMQYEERLVEELCRNLQIAMKIIKRLGWNVSENGEPLGWNIGEKGE